MDLRMLAGIFITNCINLLTLRIADKSKNDFLATGNSSSMPKNLMVYRGSEVDHSAY